MGRRIERTFAWQLPALADRVNGEEVNVNMKGGKVLHGVLIFASNDCKKMVLTDGRGSTHNIFLKDIELIHRDIPAEY